MQHQGWWSGGLGPWLHNPAAEDTPVRPQWHPAFIEDAARGRGRGRGASPRARAGAASTGRRGKGRASAAQGRAPAEDAAYPQWFPEDAPQLQKPQQPPQPQKPQQPQQPQQAHQRYGVQLQPRWPTPQPFRPPDAPINAIPGLYESAPFMVVEPEPVQPQDLSRQKATATQDWAATDQRMQAALQKVRESAQVSSQPRCGHPSCTPQPRTQAGSNASAPPQDPLDHVFRTPMPPVWHKNHVPSCGRPGSVAVDASTPCRVKLSSQPPNTNLSAATEIQNRVRIQPKRKNGSLDHVCEVGRSNAPATETRPREPLISDVRDLSATHTLARGEASVTREENSPTPPEGGAQPKAMHVSVIKSTGQAKGEVRKVPLSDHREGAAPAEQMKSPCTSPAQPVPQQGSPNLVSSTSSENGQQQGETTKEAPFTFPCFKSIEDIRKHMMEVYESIEETKRMLQNDIIPSRYEALEVFKQGVMEGLNGGREGNFCGLNNVDRLRDACTSPFIFPSTVDQRIKNACNAAQAEVRTSSCTTDFLHIDDDVANETNDSISQLKANTIKKVIPTRVVGKNDKTRRANLSRDRGRTSSPKSSAKNQSKTCSTSTQLQPAQVDSSREASKSQANPAHVTVANGSVNESHPQGKDRSSEKCSSPVLDAVSRGDKAQTTETYQPIVSPVSAGSPVSAEDAQEESARISDDFETVHSTVAQTQTVNNVLHQTVSKGLASEVESSTCVKPMSGDEPLEGPTNALEKRPATHAKASNTLETNSKVLGKTVPQTPGKDGSTDNVVFPESCKIVSADEQPSVLTNDLQNRLMNEDETLNTLQTNSNVLNETVPQSSVMNSSTCNVKVSGLSESILEEEQPDMESRHTDAVKDPSTETKWQVLKKFMLENPKKAGYSGKAESLEDSDIIPAVQQQLRPANELENIPRNETENLETKPHVLKTRLLKTPDKIAYTCKVEVPRVPETISSIADEQPEGSQNDLRNLLTNEDQTPNTFETNSQVPKTCVLNNPGKEGSTWKSKELHLPDIISAHEEPTVLVNDLENIPTDEVETPNILETNSHVLNTCVHENTGKNGCTCNADVPRVPETVSGEEQPGESENDVKDLHINAEAPNMLKTDSQLLDDTVPCTYKVESPRFPETIPASEPRGSAEDLENTSLNPHTSSNLSSSGNTNSSTSHQVDNREPCKSEMGTECRAEGDHCGAGMGSFSCKICKFTARAGHVFERHLLDHDTTQCVQCDRKFRKENDLKRHIRASYILQCRKCSQKFKTERALKEHFENCIKLGTCKKQSNAQVDAKLNISNAESTTAHVSSVERLGTSFAEGSSVDQDKSAQLHAQNNKTVKPISKETVATNASDSLSVKVFYLDDGGALQKLRELGMLYSTSTLHNPVAERTKGPNQEHNSVPSTKTRDSSCVPKRNTDEIRNNCVQQRSRGKVKHNKQTEQERERYNKVSLGTQPTDREDTYSNTNTSFSITDKETLFEEQVLNVVSARDLEQDEVPISRRTRNSKSAIKIVGPSTSTDRNTREMAPSNDKKIGQTVFSSNCDVEDRDLEADTTNHGALYNRPDDSKPRHIKKSGVANFAKSRVEIVRGKNDKPNKEKSRSVEENSKFDAYSAKIKEGRSSVMIFKKICEAGHSITASNKSMQQCGNQLSNRSGNETGREPDNQPSNQSSDQPDSQSSDQSKNEPGGQSSNESNHQSCNLSDSKPGSQPSHEPGRQPTHQAGSHSSNESDIQSSGQPDSEPGSRPSHESGSRPSHESGSQPSHEPGSQPSHEPRSQLASYEPGSHSSNECDNQSSGQPDSQPGSRPSHECGTQPSRERGSQPSHDPRSQPASHEPGSNSSNEPDNQSSGQPGSEPGSEPGSRPGHEPVSQPSHEPGSQPASHQPGCHSSNESDNQSSGQPDSEPVSQRSHQPGSQPSHEPGSQPSHEPGSQPSHEPGSQPSHEPGSQPSHEPGSQPSHEPGSHSRNESDNQSSGQPDSEPGNQRSHEPGSQPSHQPGSQPSHQPGSQSSDQSDSAPPDVSQHNHQPGSPASAQSDVQSSDQSDIEPGSQTSHQPASQSSNQSDNAPGSPSSGQTDVQSSDQSENKPGSQPTHQSSDESDNQFGTQPCKQPGKQSSNEPGSQCSSEPGMRPDNEPCTQSNNEPGNKISSGQDERDDKVNHFPPSSSTHSPPEDVASTSHSEAVEEPEIVFIREVAVSTERTRRLVSVKQEHAEGFVKRCARHAHCPSNLGVVGSHHTRRATNGEVIEIDLTESHPSQNAPQNAPQNAEQKLTKPSHILHKMQNHLVRPIISDTPLRGETQKCETAHSSNGGNRSEDTQTLVIQLDSSPEREDEADSSSY